MVVGLLSGTEQLSNTVGSAGTVMCLARDVSRVLGVPGEQSVLDEQGAPVSPA